MAVMRMKAASGQTMAAAATPDESAAKSGPAHPWAPPVGLAVLVAGAVGAWALYKAVDPTDFVPGSQYAAFAGLFVVSLAVERLLEPFSGYLVPTVELTKQKRDAMMALAINTGEHKHAQLAAEVQKELGKTRADRAILMWAIASVVAMLGSAALGVFLLRSVVVQPAGKDPNRFLDLLVTGLVVGAGTKPLHDLTSRIQVSRDKAQDPAEAQG